MRRPPAGRRGRSEPGDRLAKALPVVSRRLDLAGDRLTPRGGDRDRGRGRRDVVERRRVDDRRDRAGLDRDHDNAR